MAEHRRTVKDISGRSVEGIVIAVEESTERFSDVKLADGTVLKTKLIAIDAVRMVDVWDPEGNPVYSLKTSNIVAVSESPQELKRKVQ